VRTGTTSGDGRLGDGCCFRPATPSAQILRPHRICYNRPMLSHLEMILRIAVGAALGSGRTHLDQLDQMIEIRRFDELMVEAGFAHALQLVCPAATGEGDEARGP
jgi:hypothetical protein